MHGKPLDCTGKNLRDDPNSKDGANGSQSPLTAGIGDSAGNRQEACRIGQTAAAYRKCSRQLPKRPFDAEIRKKESADATGRLRVTKSPS